MRTGTAQDELGALRREALERFLAAGFPTQRHEDWKYTNLRRLENRVVLACADAVRRSDHVQRVDRRRRDAHRVGQWSLRAGAVVARARIRPASPCSRSPRGCEHEPARSRRIPALTPRADTARRSSSSISRSARTAWSCRSRTAAKLDTPIYVVHQWSDARRAAHEPSARHRARRPQQSLHADRAVPRARRRRVLHQRGDDAAAGRRARDSSTTACSRNRRARSTSPRSAPAADGRDATPATTSRWARPRSESASRRCSKAAGAHAALHGLFAPLGTQHLDAHTRIDHVAAHTTSEEDYRGIAGGRGRGVFNGKVIVRAGRAEDRCAPVEPQPAAVTDGAEIDTKPELEIYANDVKCSHGATTGQLDATALFYLRSRGLSEADARAAADPRLRRIHPDHDRHAPAARLAGAAAR